MTLNELNTAIAREADTSGTKINAADVARVTSCLFRFLVKQPPEKVAAVLSRGLSVAKVKLSRFKDCKGKK